MKIRFWILLAVVCLPLQAQFTYFYGQNKVIRKPFKWKFVESPHFRVFHYSGGQEAMGIVLEEAERAYARISGFLGITIEKKTPIIFYARQTDIEQTNLIPYIIPPGSFEGFTEPIGSRVVIYGNRPRPELSVLITHELTHSFENEMLYKNRSSSMMSIRRPPLWVLEGLADFMTGRWDSFYLMTVLDYVVTDRIPELQENGDIAGSYITGRTPYDMGHLMYDFFFEKYGRRGVQKILEAQRRPTFVSKGRSFLEMFDYTPKTFNYEFKKYARERFRSYFTKENPEDYSVMIGSEMPYVYSFSHQISPGGEMAAILTANYRNLKYDIVLISLKDGKVIKNITPGVRTIYDGIWNNFLPQEGRCFCWDRQARRLAFFARKEYSYYLILLDVTTGKITSKVRIRDIEKPSSPLFHPQSGQLYFSGVEGLQSLVYSMDLSKGEVHKVTTGKMFIREFDFSPDGKQIIYSGRQGDYSKLFLAPVESPEMGRQLTTGAWNDINPAFGNNGKSVYFSSDEKGTCNICALDLENQWLTSLTDVRTGNFYPLPAPKQENQLIISAFHKGGFFLFRKDVSQALSKRMVQFRDPGNYEVATPPVAKESPLYKFGEAETEFYAGGAAVGQPQFNLTQKRYRPLEKIVVEALPSVTAGVGTGGEGFYGSGTVILSDLMSDYTLGLSVYSIYGYRSYQAAYFNLRHRLQYYGQFFYYTIPYYSPYTYQYEETYYQSSSLVQRSILGGRAGLYYPLSRYYRAEFSLSFYRIKQLYDFSFDDSGNPDPIYYQYWAAPIEIALVGDTIRWAEYGPNMGHTFRVALSKYFKLNQESLDTYIIEADFRKYFRIDNNTLAALRLYGYHAGGDTPLPMWSGGNNTLRSTYYSDVIGYHGFVFNAELRFPLIQAALTPIGVIGPIRGVLFFDMGRFWFDETFRLFESGAFPKLDTNITSSYGFGLQTWLLGIPFHFDWVYNTRLTDANENKRYFGFRFWIGYDF